MAHSFRDVEYQPLALEDIQQDQPKPTPMMQPSGPGGNRNSLNKPLNKDGKREWSHDLCSFTEDCGTCCLAFCCPCSVYGKNLTRRNYLTEKGMPHPKGGVSCGGDAWTHFCLSYWCFGIGWCLQIPSRRRTRERYNIEGDIFFNDCCVSFCCNPCALTQEAREIRLEENTLMFPADTDSDNSQDLNGTGSIQI